MVFIVLESPIAYSTFGVVRRCKVMVLERLGGLEPTFAGVAPEFWVDESDMLLNCESEIGFIQNRCRNKPITSACMESSLNPRLQPLQEGWFDD